jgi:hypothetical protein
VFKFGGHLGLYTLQFLIPLYCISCHIGDNVSFKFGGVDRHTIYLFVCLFGCFCFVYLPILFVFVYKKFLFCYVVNQV